MDDRQEVILIVEGDPRLLAASKARLEQERYRVLPASSAADAIDQSQRSTVSLILLGHRPSDGLDGIAVLANIRAAGVNAPVVVITDDREIGSAIVAFQAGVRDFVGNSESSLDFLATIVARTLGDAGWEQLPADSEAIAARTVTEEAIRRERDITAKILSCLPGVFYMYDESLRFLRWNRQFEIVTGYTPDELRVMSPLDFSPLTRSRSLSTRSTAYSSMASTKLRPTSCRRTAYGLPTTSTALAPSSMAFPVS